MHLDSSSSWLSFGALPSQNIPSKRFPSKLVKARRSIFKHSVSKKVRQNSFQDIKKEAEQKLPTGWNMTSSSTELCFYRKNKNWINDMIKLTVTNSLSFIVTFFGIPVPQQTKEWIDLKGNGICDILSKLESCKFCCGYETVIKSSNWLSVSLFSSPDIHTHSTRYMHMHYRILV